MDGRKNLQRTGIAGVFVLLMLANVSLVVKEWLRNKVDLSDRHERELSGPQADDTAGGAVFTRWGRFECPHEDDLVYEGFAAGSHYSHTGGGSNYLCLAKDPIFGIIIAGTQNEARVYGAEYQTGANKHGSFSDANAEAIHDHDVPCAVCAPSGMRAVVMIPGRSECYGTWQKQYSGYLVAGHHSHKARTEFVCMDEAPEADPDGYRNDDGALFYQAEANCGSLSCPPYANGKELTCVVCTK